MRKSVISYILILICLTLCCIYAGCGGNGEADVNKDGAISVVSTSFPGYDFARAVMGNDAEISMLINPGEETHSFDPTPADIIEIQNCDMFIYAGGESDEWARTILASCDTSDMKIVSMTEICSLLEEEEKEGMMEEKGEEHHSHESHAEDGEEEEGEEEEYDEHVWTSPVNAVEIINAVKDGLCELNPEKASLYESNAAEYISEIQDLDGEFRKFLESREKPLLIFGDRFPFLYFVKEYGIDYYAAFPGCSAQTEPNSKTIAFLIDKAREEKVKVILNEAMSNDNIARAIAEENGGEVRFIYAMDNVPADEFERGDTYVTLLRHNITVLKMAL